MGLNGAYKTGPVQARETPEETEDRRKDSVRSSRTVADGGWWDRGKTRRRELDKKGKM